MIKILIVEDEEAIRRLLEMNLTDAGYCCTCADNGLKAADLIEENTYDLILLDIMLPGADGFELLEYIRPLEIPVIFLTARSDVKDRVKGLSAGAEDYIVKPFAIVELLARVEVVLRRYHKGQDICSFEEFKIDTKSRTVKKNMQFVDLTPKEFDLFLLFVRNKDIALSRSRIFETVWEGELEGDTRTLDLHVLRLRKKLGIEKRLKTVYKLGYRLESE